jgi:serine/alanine adding enzyme
MVIRGYEKADHKQLEDYLSGSANSSVYHCIPWKAVIEKSFRHRCDYLIAWEDGAIRGVLPLVHIKSLLFGNYMVSLPYFNYGGPCADTEGVRSALIHEAIRLARMRNAAHIEFRGTDRWDNGFPVKTGKASMVLPLPPSSEELWKSFPSKLRSQIKRPGREGMVVQIGKEEELDSFYKVFSVNMRDLGTPVYPMRFFENILSDFPENTWISTVYRDQEAVASGLLIGYKNRMEIPWASSLRKYDRSSPNMLLYWGSLRFACDSGYGIFDFGRSTPGEGTYRFKEQWGAKPIQMHWHYWLRDGEPLPEMNPRNPRYEIAIRVWKMLPVPIANIMGPPIVRNLP